MIFGCGIPVPPELGNLGDLLLQENQLSGEIPSELGNLSHMTELVLFNNRLTGRIPPELGSLAKLRWLWLGENQLTGEIPAELGNLSHLMSPTPGFSGGTLQLDRNHLTGEIPAELGNLTELTDLLLHGNPGLRGRLPRTLNNLQKLSALSFFDTGLCAPADPVFRDWLSGIYLWEGDICDGAFDPREVL